MIFCIEHHIPKLWPWALEYIMQPMGGLPLPPLRAPQRAPLRFELMKMIQYA